MSYMHRQGSSALQCLQRVSEQLMRAVTVLASWTKDPVIYFNTARKWKMKFIWLSFFDFENSEVKPQPELNDMQIDKRTKQEVLGRTKRHTWYDADRIENDASNNSSIAACVFVAAVTFLPSRCLATDWWEVFMKYAVQMGSGAMIYIPSFMKICSAIQKLLRGNTQTHRQHGARMNLLSFFQNKESSLKMKSKSAKPASVVLSSDLKYRKSKSFSFRKMLINTIWILMHPWTAFPIIKRNKFEIRLWQTKIWLLFFILEYRHLPHVSAAGLSPTSSSTTYPINPVRSGSDFVLI
jgi:hypothetical protein